MIGVRRESEPQSARKKALELITLYDVDPEFVFHPDQLPEQLRLQVAYAIDSMSTWFKPEQNWQVVAFRHFPDNIFHRLEFVLHTDRRVPLRRVGLTRRLDLMGTLNTNQERLSNVWLNHEDKTAFHGPAIYVSRKAVDRLLSREDALEILVELSTTAKAASKNDTPESKAYLKKGYSFEGYVYSARIHPFYLGEIYPPICDPMNKYVEKPRLFAVKEDRTRVVVGIRLVDLATYHRILYLEAAGAKMSEMREIAAKLGDPEA